MGTSSNAIAANSGGMFNGTSRYAQDFASVISRANAINSMPINLLSNSKDKLTAQATDMGTLNDSFAALQSAVRGIQDALGGSSFQAIVSDTAKVSASVGDGAVEGVYSIDVVAAGAYATSMTPQAWAADSAQHTYQLSMSGVLSTITTTDNSAAGVAGAINQAYGGQVHAAVVNVGTSAAPELRISLQATSLGDSSPDIIVDGTGVQGQKTTGAMAQYIVNGSGKTVTSSSQSVQISDGLTVTLKGQTSGTPVNITVSRSTAALSDAMTKFTTAYNSAVDALDRQHGEATGSLAGNPVVNDLSQVLSQLSTYSGSGHFTGLRDLGVTLDKSSNGHLNFDSFKLMATDITNSSDVLAFLGSSTGNGFLKTATDLLNKVEAAGTGMLPMAQADTQSQITTLTNSIADQQTRVDAMAAQMQQQISAADALIASMEQQYNYLSGMFSAMQTADQQYK